MPGPWYHEGMSTPPTTTPQELDLASEDRPERRFFSLLNALYAAQYAPQPEWDALMAQILPQPDAPMLSADGFTHFMMALWTKKTAVAARLLESGCNPHHLGKNEKTVSMSLVSQMGKKFHHEATWDLLSVIRDHTGVPHPHPTPTPHPPDWFAIMMGVRESLSTPSVAKIVRHMTDDLPSDVLSDWSKEFAASPNTLGGSAEWLAHVSRRGLNESISKAQVFSRSVHRM